MAPKKSFPLRIDPKLYEILERWAADEFRSVNAHIEYVLRDAAVRAGRLGGAHRHSGGPAPSAPPIGLPLMPEAGDSLRNAETAPERTPPSGTDKGRDE